jgi:hypothetical protein
MAKDYGKGDSCIDIKSIYKLDSDHDYMDGDPPLKSEGSDPCDDPDYVGA